MNIFIALKRGLLQRRKKAAPPREAPTFFRTARSEEFFSPRSDLAPTFFPAGAALVPLSPPTLVVLSEAVSETVLPSMDRALQTRRMPRKEQIESRRNPAQANFT